MEAESRSDAEAERGRMKLRNKKTGNIGDYLCAIQGDDIKLWSATNSYETYHYKCMSEFINEWEDYKPVEPLIEDQKTRKVFREWADLFGAKRFRVDHLCEFGRTVITSNDLEEEPSIELPGYFGIDSETYTIVELCGEE